MPRKEEKNHESESCTDWEGGGGFALTYLTDPLRIQTSIILFDVKRNPL
jgi:hypothetical protein